MNKNMDNYILFNTFVFQCLFKLYLCFAYVLLKRLYLKIKYNVKNYKCFFVNFSIILIHSNKFFNKKDYNILAISLFIDSLC